MSTGYALLASATIFFAGVAVLLWFTRGHTTIVDDAELLLGAMAVFTLASFILAEGNAVVLVTSVSPRRDNKFVTRAGRPTQPLSQVVRRAGCPSSSFPANSQCQSRG